MGGKIKSAIITFAVSTQSLLISRLKTVACALFASQLSATLLLCCSATYAEYYEGFPPAADQSG